MNSTFAYESPWIEARRNASLDASVVGDVLKIAESPGIISFAGGLPSPRTFPVQALQCAYSKVLRQDAHGALQYGPSEGYTPLREMIAATLPWDVDPAHVIITTGSQQGLDLVSKVCIDPGSSILTDNPTFLGALQTFKLMEPVIHGVINDAEGVDVVSLGSLVAKERPRFLYVLPNFQNPTGRTMSERARNSLTTVAKSLRVPILEDDPYGELWFDQPPPLPLAARNPQGCIYLGSFSKVLAPGLRLGYMVVPAPLLPKFLHTKQAADLHTPGINQRVAFELMSGDLVKTHIPMIRQIYKSQRDAMLNALATEFPTPQSDANLTWNRPDGGMFLWAKLPHGMDAAQLLPFAIERGVAFVPGAPFYVCEPDRRTLRLSYVTPSLDEIQTGIAALAQAIKAYSLRAKVTMEI